MKGAVVENFEPFLIHYIYFLGSPLWAGLAQTIIRLASFKVGRWPKIFEHTGLHYGLFRCTGN